MLSNVDNLSLDFLNRASLAWVEQEYNRAENEEMKAAPINEYIEVKDVTRPSPDEEKFKFSFTRPETRKQRKTDGTIKLQFEIPSRFRHIQKLHLRYQSWDFKSNTLKLNCSIRFSLLSCFMSGKGKFKFFFIRRWTRDIFNFNTFIDRCCLHLFIFSPIITDFYRIQTGSSFFHVKKN